MQPRALALLLASLAVTAIVGAGWIGAGLATAQDEPGWSGEGFTITSNHSIVVGDGRSAHVHDTIKTADGGVLLVGGERVGGNYPGPHKATVWKVRPNGTLAWETTLGGNYTVATAIARTDDGYVLTGVAGFVTEGPDADLEGPEIVTPYVWRVSPAGTLQRNTSVDTDRFRYPNDVHPTENGVVLAGVANARLVDNEVSQGEGWVARIDASGTVTWEVTPEGRFGGRFTAMTATEDAITVVGTLEGNTSHPWVFQLGDDGTVVGNHTIGNISGVGGALLRGEDGDLIVAGTVIRNVTGDAASEARLAVWRVNASMGVEWSRVLANSSGAKATDLLRRSSGRIVATGEVNLPGADAAILELEPGGTVTGVAVFGGQWPEYPVGVHEHEDQLLVAGYLERTDFSHIEDAWLAGVSLTGGDTGDVGTIADPTTTTRTTTSPAVTGTTSGDSGPGFGVLPSLIAALILGLAISRLRR